MANHDLAVDGKGMRVRRRRRLLANDDFIPPTPVANFGIHSQITVAAHDDGSLDVAWLDYAGGKSAPWAVPAPAMINVTHIDAALATAIATTATGSMMSYKLLGFAEDRDRRRLPRLQQGSPAQDVHEGRPEQHQR